MSITSGPMVPPYTGNSSVLSPPYVSFAAPLASMIPTFVLASIDASPFRLCSPKFLHDGPDPRVVRVGPPHDQVEKVIVGHREQTLQRLSFLGRGILRACPVLLENEVQLQQPPPASPLQPFEATRIHG